MNKGSEFPTVWIKYLILLPFIFGCAPESTTTTPQTDSLTFDGSAAFNEVKELVRYTPRDAGTRGARKAAEHIQKRMVEFGINTEIQTFEDETPEGTKTFHNVIGRISGKNGKWVILGSHFDTMPGIENFQGANDGGSSTGVLLELAHILSGIKPNTGIIFAFFDGEEGIDHYSAGDGLHGSRYMVRQLLKSGESKKITAMILLDMVGDKDLHFTIPRNSSQSITKRILDAANAIGARDCFSLGLDSAITDDHEPFRQIGIPSIDIIDFRFGSAPGRNDFWHTGQDNLTNISAESLDTTGDVVLKALESMLFE